MGSDILSVRQFRKLGVEPALSRVPAGVDCYLSIDVDGFDHSIAAGNGTRRTAGSFTTSSSTASGAEDA